MGVKNASVASTTIVNAAIVGNAETVVVTTPTLNLPLDGAMVFLFAMVLWTPGAGTTSSSLRLRRGTGTTGTVVNIPTAYVVVAAQTTYSVLLYPDTPGIVAEQQWSLTIGTAGATANHSVSDVAMIAMVL